MAEIYVLYNPLSGSGKDEANIRLMEAVSPEPLHFFDITKITDYSAFFGGMGSQDRLIISGGDGTLNRFVNDTADIDINRDIMYFPVGSGNDFARELGRHEYSDPFDITEYLKDLPSVEVNGKTYKFLNGVGFGIDGYCCEEGDRLRRLGKKVNYTLIAVKGLLFGFKARNAAVYVDGKEYKYEKVWIAPTMYGRYYGGGMIPVPGQSRNNQDKAISVMVFYGAGRLRTLCAFPGIFKGTHVKHKSMVAIHTGHEIKVEFDRPTPLQFDGETILNVKSYTARSSLCTDRLNIHKTFETKA